MNFCSSRHHNPAERFCAISHSLPLSKPAASVYRRARFAIFCPRSEPVFKTQADRLFRDRPAKVFSRLSPYHFRASSLLRGFKSGAVVRLFLFEVAAVGSVMLFFNVLASPSHHDSRAHPRSPSSALECPRAARSTEAWVIAITTVRFCRNASS